MVSVAYRGSLGRFYPKVYADELLMRYFDEKLRCRTFLIKIQFPQSLSRKEKALEYGYQFVAPLTGFG